MGKRSNAGYYNQIRHRWRRSKYKKSCAWKLQHPQYVHLRLDVCVLEIEFRPLVPISNTPAAFERFRGWLVRTVRPSWPIVRLKLHSSKAPGTHLHNQRWKWFDQSNLRGLVFGFTSHQGNQRFHFMGAVHLLRQLREVLFPVPGYKDLVVAPQWTSHDEEDPPGDGPPLLPYLSCS